MYNIDEIMDMLDWNQPEEVQRRGWLDNLREFQGTDTLTECENASTNERFARRVYEGLVEGFVNIDREKYGANYVFYGMPEPQRKAIELYNALNEEQKDVFLSVLRQVRTDMVRSMFSIMEGQAGEWINLDFETELKINGKSTDDELTSTYGRMIREMNLDQKVVHGEMNFDMSPIPVSTQ